jgi:surface polysaccharide O-acyltransferase-like enzyme
MENKYYEEIDISRGIAIIGVVILHASSLYLSRFYNNYLWIINSMARFSVPLFIVISGFLHKDIADIREGVVRSYLKKSTSNSAALSAVLNVLYDHSFSY